MQCDTLRTSTPCFWRPSWIPQRFSVGGPPPQASAAEANSWTLQAGNRLGWLSGSATIGEVSESGGRVMVLRLWPRPNGSTVSRSEREEGRSVAPSAAGAAADGQLMRPRSATEHGFANPRPTLLGPRSPRRAGRRRLPGTSYRSPHSSADSLKPLVRALLSEPARSTIPSRRPRRRRPRGSPA